MIMRDYYMPYSVEEAVRQYLNDDGIIFAGGTDLMVKGRGKDCYQDKAMISIQLISELQKIQETKEDIRIGAGVILSEICDSEIIQKHIPLLVKAVSAVANCQIRNRATLAGNIANACPASDCIPVLMVLGASVIVQGVNGTRRIKIEELFHECKACLRHESMQVRTCFFQETTLKKLTLNPSEIITEIVIPKQLSDEQYLFYKLSQNHSSDLGVMNMTMIGKKDDTGKIIKLRVSMGGLFAKPRCFEELNEIIIGQKAEKTSISLYADAAEEILQKESQILLDFAYKKRVMKNLIVDGCMELFLGISMEA